MHTKMIAAIKARITEYEAIREICTDDPHADMHFNRAIDMILSDLKELIEDTEDAKVLKPVIVRHLHAVN